MAQLSGAKLVRYGLEQLGITHTFGIPGVHNTELYDELNESVMIEPILVTHEAGASFMADAISRTSDKLGCLLIVPGAGAAYASAGIGEAYLDGIPMLVISGGTRTDSEYAYQLHQMDQLAMLEPISKGQYLIDQHEDILPTLYSAYQLATGGEPGPVIIEVPVNIQLFCAPCDYLSYAQYAKQYPQATPKAIDADQISAACEYLRKAEKVGIFVGWGAREAKEQLMALAQLLGAPVATSLQGLASFPAEHPLHTGMSFGAAAVPAAQQAFKDCDCLLAIGVRFGEIATGSYSCPIPENLIHIDINSSVFNVNYPAKVAIEGDANAVCKDLLAQLEQQRPSNSQTQQQQQSQKQQLIKQIAKDKARYRAAWARHKSGQRLNPLHFFDALSDQLSSDAIIVLDDGNHTFLAAELLPIKQGMQFISPTDFNCMGYAVPAAIGAKLLNPSKQVVTIVGDGCFSMTAMEIMTASKLGLGVLFCIFNDGELAQIAQAQSLPYNRKPCTNLPQTKFEGVAIATGARYFRVDAKTDLVKVLAQAHTHTLAGQSVILDIQIDYSKKTRFTQGILATNFKRMQTRDKRRLLGRAIKRKVRLFDT